MRRDINSSILPLSNFNLMDALELKALLPEWSLASLLTNEWQSLLENNKPELLAVYSNTKSTKARNRGGIR